MSMNEKVLQTRIVNKHADFSAWDSSSLVLKEGEIALAKLSTIRPDGGTEDNYIAKIGTGKVFNESAWLYAKASDVYSWAKATTKPSYNSLEIARGSSTVDADLEIIEDEIDLLKAAVGSEGSVAEAIKAAIEALDENTWAAEDGIKFVTAVGEADGKITVVRRELTAADIPQLAMGKITGLVDALAEKATKAELEDAVDALEGTITTNAQTAANATAAVAEDLVKLTARVKTVEDDYTTVEQAGTIAEGKVDAYRTTNDARVEQVEGDIENLELALSGLAGTDRTNETVKGNADAIALLKEQIGNVANVMNFRGVSTGETVGADIENPVNGDVIIFGQAEYVYDGSEWVKFGDASDNATAISDLQDRVSTIETDLGTEGSVTKAIEAAAAKGQQGIDDAKKANDAIALIKDESTGILALAKADATDKANKALDDAKLYADGKVEEVSDALDAHIAKKDNPHEVTKAQVGLSEVDNKSVATIKSEFTGAIAADNDGFVKGGDIHTAIEAAKTAVNGYTDEKVEDLADALDSAEESIGIIQNNYARVEGDTLVYGQGDAAMVIVFDCGGAV